MTTAFFWFRNKQERDMTQGPHHYVLGHIALRQVCQANPMAFFNVMVTPHRQSFLGNLWSQVRQTCDPEGEPSFDISDIEITTCRIKGFPTIVFKMPPPMETTETYFIAIVLKIDPDTETQPEHPSFDYLTLEKGANLDGSERRVLCGWTEDEKHMNYGEGPEANLDAFIGAIENMI
jgi:hypothetical protein